MYRIARGLLILALAVPALAAAGQPTKEPAAPAEPTLLKKQRSQ